MSTEKSVVWIFRSDRTLEQLKLVMDALVASGLPLSTPVTVHSLHDGAPEGVTLPAGVEVADPLTGLRSASVGGVVTYSTCPEAGIVAILG